MIEFSLFGFYYKKKKRISMEFEIYLFKVNDRSLLSYRRLNGFNYFNVIFHGNA